MTSYHQTPVKCQWEKIKVKDFHIRDRDHDCGAVASGVAIVSVMVNQPQTQTSETDISLYDSLVRRSGLLWKGSEGQWPTETGHTQ